MTTEQEPRSPYQPPSARLAGEEPQQLPTALYVFAALALPLALWYLVFDGRKWFDPAYLEHVGAGEKVATWTTRALYAIPKLGVIIGFVSLLKFQRYSARIYLACWLFAMGHTAMYYRSFRLPLSEIEWMRLAVHHVIPHLFYAGMLVSLYWFRRRIR